MNPILLAADSGSIGPLTEYLQFFVPGLALFFALLFAQWRISVRRRRRPQQRVLTPTEKIEEMKRLPPLPLKTALRIESNFRGWSLVLALWYIYGVFYFVNTGNAALNYPKAPDDVATGSLTAKFYELLGYYFTLKAIVAFLAWVFIFPTRNMFVRRRRQGPKELLILLAVVFGIDVLGVLLTVPIPMAALQPLDLPEWWLMITPTVFLGIVMLTLMPFFGEAASLYYQYTELDPNCFKKNGVGLGLLKNRSNG